MPEEAEPREILTFEQACEFLGIRERTLRRWIVERQVPHAKIGGLLRFRRSALLAWVEAQERQTMEGGDNGEHTD